MLLWVGSSFTVLHFPHSWDWHGWGPQVTWPPHWHYSPCQEVWWLDPGVNHLWLPLVPKTPVSVPNLTPTCILKPALVCPFSGWLQTNSKFYQISTIKVNLAETGDFTTLTNWKSWFCCCLFFLLSVNMTSKRLKSCHISKPCLSGDYPGSLHNNHTGSSYNECQYKEQRPLAILFNIKGKHHTAEWVYLNDQFIKKIR